MWSAPAERSVDGALERDIIRRTTVFGSTGIDIKLSG
jgi:hypothetical protein